MKSGSAQWGGRCARSPAVQGRSALFPKPLTRDIYSLEFGLRDLSQYDLKGASHCIDGLAVAHEILESHSCREGSDRINVVDDISQSLGRILRRHSRRHEESRL